MLLAGLGRRFSRFLIIFALSFLEFVSPGRAETAKALKGVALVIGQSQYEHLTQLSNPANDAQDVAKLFSDLGFNVTTTLDRNTKKLRRDLENFASDAEGSDVAVVYYSGHGIEAGGENWLVPVDAGVAALADAGEGLVPLSSLMEELKANVPLTLLFLDACRTNPFPPGTALKRDGTELPVRASGLSLTKGFSATNAEAGSDGLGVVIAFAAEPGMVALDGPPKGNSPYAAAFLRHLSASTGSEFGTVMRLVTQEVYLKTGGKQRPWVNETLTRLLYFGVPRADLSGDEGQILNERRQVLLTIASLDDSTRRQVEAAAQQAGVPMDALYGLLNALGAEVPKDPAKLDAVLKAQTETVKKKLAILDALGRQDSEVARLSALADKALADGAIQANLKFMQAAAARQKAVDGTLDQAESGLRTSRIASGAIKAKLAEAFALNFAFDKAALSYEEAYLQVEKWDRAAAFDYKLRAAGTMQHHGDVKGDNAALLAAIDAYGEARVLMPRGTDPHNWAMTQTNLGNALSTLGSRESGTARLEEAVTAYRAALEEFSRDRVPLDWALTQNNLGTALTELGERDSDTARLEEAVTAYRAVLNEWTRDRVPLDWAMTKGNLGNVLSTLGSRESGTARLEEAVTAYRAALEEFTRDRVPLQWALIQNNLGTTLAELGGRESDTARLEEAVASYRAALEERTRDRVPLGWAMTQNNLGNALIELGERESDTARLEEAVMAYRAALEEWTRDRVPLDWALTQNNLGNALRIIGSSESGTARLEEAVKAFRSALTEFTRDRVPLQWAVTQHNLGTALKELGERESDGARLEEAVTAYRAALQERTRARVSLEWAATQYNLGNALSTLGSRESGTVRLAEAVIAYRAALDELTRDRVPLQWARIQNQMGWTLGMEGARLTDLGRVREGRDAVQAAWEMFRLAGYGNDTYFRERVEALNAVLAQIEALQ